MFYCDPALHTLLTAPHLGLCLCGVFQNDELYDNALRPAAKR